MLHVLKGSSDRAKSKRQTEDDFFKIISREERDREMSQIIGERVERMIHVGMTQQEILKELVGDDPEPEQEETKRFTVLRPAPSREKK